MKSEYRRKQEAKERASKDLQLTKNGWALVRPSLCAARPPIHLLQAHGRESPRRRPHLTEYQDPAGDFMHAHRWKRHARETEATVKEIRRKASKIAPAYNKGALQYLRTRKTAEGSYARATRTAQSQAMFR